MYIREQFQAWAKKNKKHLQVYRSRYYEKNKRRLLGNKHTYNATHRPQLRETEKAYRKRLRDAVLVLLGGVCVRCGFSDRRALQIDHIKGNGFIERKILQTLPALCRKILRMNDPSREYQILCANCNWIKRVENEEYANMTALEENTRGTLRT